MKLLMNYVKKDLQKNKVITIALSCFLLLSAVLMATGFRVTGTMISSLSGLNEIALPPDYIQMHKGEIDEEAFYNFLEDKSYIEKGQIVESIIIRNSNIIFENETFENFLMDNGFIIQNKHFDYLLNLDNHIASVDVGFIGVPVYYHEVLGINVGDQILIRDGNSTMEFTVSTIIRDAAMNVALTSSKRFLIHEEDFKSLSEMTGEYEYSFEFLLTDQKYVSTLENDYKNANLPNNGIGISGTIIVLMNGISYGITSVIIIGISILLIMMGSLSLSYIIRATLTEERISIGQMKAIGLNHKAIRKLYQTKYMVLVICSACFGYFIAIPIERIFSSSVLLYCGQGQLTYLKWIMPLIGLILLSLYVVFRIKRILTKNLRNTVVELLKGKDRIKEEGHYKLPKHKLKFKNISIALGELKCKWRGYIVIFIVFLLASFLMLLPAHMMYTIEDSSFITYMGVGSSDVRIDFQYQKSILEDKNMLINHLENDKDIKKYAVYAYSYISILKDDQTFALTRVEYGDYDKFPVGYLEGNRPSNANEIALSYLNAKELNKKVGDDLTVYYKNQELSLSVSGIYQDITYGGKTSKALIDFDEADVEVYIVYIDLADHVDILSKTNELRSIVSQGKVTPITQFISQTLSGIQSNLSLVVNASYTISILLIVLITTMMIKLIIAKEHASIAFKKAIGFQSSDIRIQYSIRLLVILILAIGIGTVLANTLGEFIFSMMLKNMGAAKINILVEPIKSYLIIPMVQIITVIVTIYIATNVIKTYHIRDQIIE